MRDAIGAVRHDNLDRYQTGFSDGLEAMQIAFDWQANDNEKRCCMYLPDSEKRAVHLKKQDAHFCSGANEVAQHLFHDSARVADSIEWIKHFPNDPIVQGVISATYPDEKIFKPGSLEHCMAWSDFNIQRIAQHRLVLAVCSKLLFDAHAFKHLIEPLERMQDKVWRTKERLKAIHLQLVVLEGNPAKIQALRESMLHNIRLENRSTGHFYGHFNAQHSNGSESEARFRDEALRHVQAGFQPSIDSALLANTSYSDLGLI